jgi:hypothetical protein
LPLPDTLERATAAPRADLAAATLAAAPGAERAVAASRARAALTDSTCALRATRRPEPALARTRRTLPGAAATQLLSALLGAAPE